MCLLKMPSDLVALSIEMLWVQPAAAKHHCAVTLGKLFAPYLCASITKHYNLVLG